MKTTRDFILGLEGQQKAIVSYLDDRLSIHYDLNGKINYNVPFYYRKSWVCYLNPPKDGGVELAFVRGNELSNAQGLLDFRGRKQVAGMYFYKVAEIPDAAINEIIQEALVLDDLVKYSVRKAKK